MVAKKNVKKKVSKKPENKVTEVFEVGKEGEEKLIEKTGEVKESEGAGKEQIKKENKQLKKVLIGVGIFVGILLVFWATTKAVSTFEYKNVKFEIVKEGYLIFYNTKLPMYDIEGNHVADYNIYLRKDPRKSEVKFYGDVALTKNIVLNLEDEFNCDGDGVIAIANLNNNFFQGFLKVNTMQDENASCDSGGKYTYISIMPWNESAIIQTGPSCYKMYVKDCEILDVTEKFIVESLAKLNN